jgi:hypothetical protein
MPHMNSNTTQLSRSDAASKTGPGRTVRHICFAAAIGLALAAVNTTQAQVSNINSVIVHPRMYDDIPTATLTAVTNYPSLISFDEQNVTSSSGYANRDAWSFSGDGGLTAYSFQSNDYFTVSMNVTLTGDPITPRKEAGFAFSDGGEYILDTDGHEIVAFGGNLPFCATALDGTFQSGQTITMGMTIFIDSNGKYAIIYSANGINSPALEFAPGATEQGATLGGYFQIQTTTNSPNSGSAVYQNISIGAGVPLGIAATANQVVVYWPASPTNYVLQTSTNLNSTNWTTVNGLPITGMTVPATLPASFFRLQAQ